MRGSALNPSWGSLQLSPKSLAGGEGARCSLPKNSSPISACGLEFWPFGPQESPQKAMSSVSNQSCCKGFRFTEKVEKHWIRVRVRVRVRGPI